MSIQFFITGVFTIIAGCCLAGMSIANALGKENIDLAARTKKERERQKCLFVCRKAQWWFDAFSFGSGFCLFILIWACTSFSWLLLCLPVFILLFEGAVSAARGKDFFSVRQGVFLFYWWNKAGDADRARTVFYFQWIVAAGILVAYDPFFFNVETLLGL